MAAPRIIRSDAAKQDLKSIYLHLAAGASPGVADFVMAGLFEAMRQAAAFPFAFRIRPEYPRQVRRINVGPYAILYERLESREGIFVLRVLHEHRDIPNVLRPP